MENSELIIVRHGETEWNKLDIIQGHLDSPLTAKGIEQAKLLAERLAAIAVDIIYSSDLGRTHATAEIIASRCAKPIVLDSRLREKHEGIIQGNDWPTVQANYPEIYAAIKSLDPDYVPPGGESYNQFLQRIVGVITEVSRRHEHLKILIVTHGGVISAFVRYVLGLPRTTPRRYSLKNLAINRFVWKKGHLVLDTLGDTSHLA
jgi:2,3-bisphosphoglycerate-dependent phosphoglycerate mutase